MPAARNGNEELSHPSPQTVATVTPFNSEGETTHGSTMFAASPLVWKLPFANTLTTRCVYSTVKPGGMNVTVSPLCNTAPVARGRSMTKDPTQTWGHIEVLSTR